LAAPSTHHSGGEKIHSSLLLFLHYLRSLYNMDLVPDTNEFNKLMMLVVAEVADNTSHVGMREYPQPLDSATGVAGKVSQPSGARFPKTSIQSKILTSGLSALERCATKYLETGGGRFASALNVEAGGGKRSKKRARGPGKALKLILHDYRVYDNKLRADARHLPAASLRGVSLPTDLKDARYACGILKKHDRTEGTVPVPKLLAMRATMKKLFKYAKRVGVDVAKCVPPPSDYSFKREISSKELAATFNCIHSPKKKREDGEDHAKEMHVEHAGILQNLNQAIHLLKEQKRTFESAKALISFLEEAVSKILGMMQNFCRARVGADKCDISAPVEHSCKLSIRHDRLPSESKKDLVEHFKTAGGDTVRNASHLDHTPLKGGEVAKRSTSSSSSHSDSSSSHTDASRGSSHSKNSHTAQANHSKSSKAAHASSHSRSRSLEHGSSRADSIPKSALEKLREKRREKTSLPHPSSNADPSSSSDTDHNPRLNLGKEKHAPETSLSSSSGSAGTVSDASDDANSPSHSSTRESQDESSTSGTPKSSTSSEKRRTHVEHPFRRSVSINPDKPSSSLASSHSKDVKSGIPGGASKDPSSPRKTPIPGWSTFWRQTPPKSSVPL